MITLTELAAKEIKRIVDEQHEAAKQKDPAADPKPLYLRVGVKGGGCSGFSYTLDLTESKSDMDEEFNQHNVDLVVDAKSNLYLDGVTIDFKDSVMGRGFVFSNPNATSSCGCGSSFSV